MSSGVEMSQQHAIAPQYARFLRRLQAMVLDSIVAVVVLSIALLAASTVQINNFSRAIGISVAIAWLLYEPVLVSFAGSTLGHYFVNLRVVDNRHGGNVSFLKAVVRFVIKTILGLFSFIVMTATRRNQALHDLLTRSTVQIRNPIIARPHDFISERTELLIPTMPSRVRRTAIICVYLLLVYIAVSIAAFILVGAGLISPACVNSSRCSSGEYYAFVGVGLIWLALSAVCIGWGWRGKLLGARTRATS